MFIKPQQDIKKPNLTEEFFRATVVDNVDPEKLGRIKIRILDIHGTDQNIPDSNLPWAIQMRPTFLGGSSQVSTFSVPRIDSEVIVTHIKGDIYQPAYVFELNNSNTILDESAEDYPESYGFKDSDGNKYHVNMEQDTLKILFNGDEFIEITKNRDTIIGESDSETIGIDQTSTIGNNKTTTIANDESNTVNNNKTENIASNSNITVGGNLTENVTGSVSQTISGGLTINVSGAVNVTAAGTASVTAPTIELNGSGGGVLTQQSINPLTGVPFPDGSSTVFAGDG